MKLLAVLVFFSVALTVVLAQAQDDQDEKFEQLLKRGRPEDVGCKYQF